ncbi:MAG: hypothetical protein LBR66_03120 [Candidatus Symbiothrix sp.]|nr:hypothetical protein [Candidatus Symbiothrix sp.]
MLPESLLRLYRRKEIKAQISYNRSVIQSLSDMLEPIHIIVDEQRQPTVNVFILQPWANMSAGPLSILYFAKFLQNMGLHIRFLIYNSALLIDEIRKLIALQNSDLYNLSQTAEIVCMPFYAGQTSLHISPEDMTVATIRQSAFHANHIQSYCRQKRFIYFIQDDERAFFPQGSLWAMTDNSYRLDYFPMFSTEVLRQAFLTNDIGGLRSRYGADYGISQQSPANYQLPNKQQFMQRNVKKRFVFYARPSESRNCYELCMYVIDMAVKTGIFDKNWELYGIGHPEILNMQMGDGVVLKTLLNQSLDDYKKLLYTFDVGLSLMATPHYSMPPIDLALSGCVVVTNTFQTKTAESLSSISDNIIGSELHPDALLTALKTAVDRAADLELRYKNAQKSVYPNGNNVFSSEHQQWIENILYGG